MGGRFAALIQEAEDEILVLDELFGIAHFARLRVGEFAVGIETADNMKLVIGLTKSKVHMGGFVRLDGKELTVGQGCAIVQTGSCREDVITLVQRRWMLESGEHHAVVDARIFGIVGQKVEAVAIELLDAEMRVIFWVGNRGGGVVVDI